MAPEYAPEGYHFARVSTSSVYREYLLPVDGIDMTPEEEAHYEELQDLAERHRTSINCGSYRAG